MANEKSAFREALNTGAGAIIGSAFPQLSNLINAMQKNKTEDDKPEKREKKQKREKKSEEAGLTAAAVNIIDEGFDRCAQRLNKCIIVLKINDA